MTDIVENAKPTADAVALAAADAIAREMADRGRGVFPCVSRPLTADGMDFEPSVIFGNDDEFRVDVAPTVAGTVVATVRHIGEDGNPDAVIGEPTMPFDGADAEDIEYAVNWAEGAMADNADYVATLG